MKLIKAIVRPNKVDDVKDAAGKVSPRALEAALLVMLPTQRWFPVSAT